MPAIPLPYRRASFLVLLFCGCMVLPALAAKPPASAPPFTLRTSSGSVALDSLRGRVVLVDFWASWCGPCHRSFPWLAAIQRKYGGQGLTVVAVNLDKDERAAAAFLAGKDVPFTVAYDPAGRTAAAYKVAGMPTSVLVGRDGSVIHSHIGYDPDKAARLESIIQEACSR